MEIKSAVLILDVRTLRLYQFTYVFIKNKIFIELEKFSFLKYNFYSDKRPKIATNPVKFLSLIKIKLAKVVKSTFHYHFAKNNFLYLMHCKSKIC